MAELDEVFNAEEVATGTDVVPAGKYLAEITDSELRDTSAGDGRYLKIALRITEGAYANRQLWDNLNLTNPSQQAVDIGRKRLSQICHAVNVLNLRNTEDLHHRPLLVDVRVKPPGPDRNGIERDAANTIAKYSPAPASPEAAPILDKKPGWSRKAA